VLLNEDQWLIRDTARRFARERVAPHAAQWAREGTLPAAILREMGDCGFLGMAIPEAFGGAATDYVSYALAIMEIAAGDGALSTLMSVHNSPVAAAIVANGTAAQREHWLPRMASGEVIGAFCLTEPQAGSDAAALKVRARRDGQHYVLSGTKQFITSGRLSGVAIVFAVTDPKAGKNGVTAFLVDTGLPGYVVAKVEEKLGQAASDTCQIVFDDMAVPADAVLGKPGDGYRIALSNLETGRIGIASQSVGMAQAALDVAVAYAKDRQSFGKPIFEHQAVGFRLADMAARLEAARQLVLHAAALKDAGEASLQAACMAKLVASETAETVCSAAIQTLGGYGYLADYPVERIYRDVRVCQIYEGTSDIQRLVIARGL
jgi:alkylation response protein AidB-like acyl-CoA dehydrogenase